MIAHSSHPMRMAPARKSGDTRVGTATSMYKVWTSCVVEQRTDACYPLCGLGGRRDCLMCSGLVVRLNEKVKRFHGHNSGIIHRELRQ